MHYTYHNNFPPPIYDFTKMFKYKKYTHRGYNSSMGYSYLLKNPLAKLNTPSKNCKILDNVVLISSISFLISSNSDGDTAISQTSKSYFSIRSTTLFTYLLSVAYPPSFIIRIAFL